MAKIDNLFHLLHANHGSDLHLSAGNPPLLRIYGDLARVDAPVVTTEELLAVLREMVPMERVQAFEQTGDLDFAYEMDETSRFRCNYFRQQHGLGAVFRLIPTKIATLEELGVPTVVKEFAHMRSGLVLVTGPTGSGKSTTLAAIIDYINSNQARHIITVEEPIEFVHPNKKSIVTQREVPLQTPSFADGLRASLREDSDIVLVGEMRDLETISLALTAAETGHLVLGTLHTGSAARTVDRVLDVFPVEQRDQIRIMVSESLRGIISQQLVPRADGNGRALAIEMLVNTPAIANCIREGKTFMIPGCIQTGKAQGMILMDDSLRALHQAGLITTEDCIFRAEDKTIMKSFLGIK